MYTYIRVHTHIYNTVIASSVTKFQDTPSMRVLPQFDSSIQILDCHARPVADVAYGGSGVYIYIYICV